MKLRLFCICLSAVFLLSAAAVEDQRAWDERREVDIGAAAGWIQIGDEDHLGGQVQAEMALPVPSTYVCRLGIAALQGLDEAELNRQQLKARLGFRHSHDYSSNIEISTGLDVQRIAAKDVEATTTHLMIEARAIVPVWFDFECELGGSLGWPLASSDAEDRLAIHGFGGVKRYKRPEHWQMWQLQWDELPFVDSPSQSLLLSWSLGWAW